ncbi:cupin domain-containing protein [Pseudophaeobacter sp.]|uniref:cupin domain-containing protein n=1 Tax=Pseudophaeobacter sp. TaxID=1971739 RepID=UPI003A975346
MSCPLSADEVERAHGNDRTGTERVAEAGGMRIWHLRLAPGETLSAHRHDRPYFWTVLTDGTARSRYGDGRIQDITYTNRQTQHFPDLTAESGFIHDLTNTGDAELVFVTVEFDH